MVDKGSAVVDSGSKATTATTGMLKNLLLSSGKLMEGEEDEEEGLTGVGVFFFRMCIVVVIYLFLIRCSIVAPVKQTAVSSSEEGDSLEHVVPVPVAASVEQLVSEGEQQQQQQQHRQVESSVPPVQQNPLELPAANAASKAQPSSDWLRSSWKTAWSTMASALVRPVIFLLFPTRLFFLA